MDATQTVAALTLAAILTGPGIPIAALLVRQVVEYLQWSLVFFGNISGRILAFVFTFILYVVAWAFVGVHTAEGAFAALLTWLGCGMATMAAHVLLSEAHIGTKPNAADKPNP